MGLFNRQDGEVIRGTMAQMKQAPKPVQGVEMVIDYFDNSQEIVSLTYNLEELQTLIASSFETGASINFSKAQPPFAINPRWVKKVTYKVKGNVSM